MSDPLRFLVIDGYPKESRDQLQEAGMRLAWDLYERLLRQYLPDAVCDVLLPCDPDVTMPGKGELARYDGILWTGCNLTIYHDHDVRVTSQIRLARDAFAVGVPSFGSCWGLQMAAVAAGGEVRANPRGREMGLARKVYLTRDGEVHPMTAGRPKVFEGFISHDDEVVRLPPGGVHLATNAFTNVQALAVAQGDGVFWAVQYHPEYDLREMARLIVARESRLVRQGLFRGHDDLAAYVERLEALAADPTRTDLRWQLAIDDDVLSDAQRHCEFVNWLDETVLPRAGRRERLRPRAAAAE